MSKQTAAQLAEARFLARLALDTLARAAAQNVQK
jgi:hypothetical protein